MENIVCRSLSKTLMTPAYKPISGTSKDQLAKVLMPQCQGTLSKPEFGNSRHYHTELFLPRVLQSVSPVRGKKESA